MTFYHETYSIPFVGRYDFFGLASVFLFAIEFRI